jgi:hypothetical protein
MVDCTLDVARLEKQQLTTSNLVIVRPDGSYLRNICVYFIQASCATEIKFLRATNFTNLIIFIYFSFLQSLVHQICFEYVFASITLLYRIIFKPLKNSK